MTDDDPASRDLSDLPDLPDLPDAAEVDPPRGPAGDGNGLPTNLPADFLFGVTTAATCVEGRLPAADELSIWDVFAAAPGRITDGSLPTAGPRHFELVDQDVALLEDLGVDIYRLSLPWAVLAANPQAIDFYDRLLDALLARRIRPVVTLTHYDMPLDVMQRGGWLIRDAAAELADHAARMADRLADRTYAWITLSSPLTHTGYGYGLGIEAPGLTMLGGSLQAGWNQLLGHGLAVAALRSCGAARVGIANAHTRVLPGGPSATDREAAALYDALHNRAFADPIFGRPWPDELLHAAGAFVPEPSEADRTSIAAPLDFYGVNYYHPQQVIHAPANLTIPFAFAETGAADQVDSFGWPIDASALTDTLTALSRRYPNLPPLWVTENGTQDGGGLDDSHRSHYLLDHLAAIGAAVESGVDVRAYFHWSLLDGWEFAEGLTRHFGLVAVDPQTARRRTKASFRTYRALLRNRTQRPQ